MNSLSFLRQHYLDQVQRFTSNREASQPGIIQAPANYSVSSIIRRFGEDGQPDAGNRYLLPRLESERGFGQAFKILSVC
jgi:hypothetical protein